MTERILPGAVVLPDGTRVRGRGLRHGPPDGPAPDFGLYLGSARMRRRYDGELAWEHVWLDWPDFRLPRDRDRAVAEIRALHERARAGEVGRGRPGRAVEVACGGGVGRTGTVLACLAVLAGVPADDAVSWTRARFHPRAVETPWQRRWVRDFPSSPAKQ
ncbi:hypothetical protein BTM25_22420 [Actinomadura rubteroloni]|uniref:Tyrosine specific protein phosphatases domain-containing protein n=1 Tax=Actinomadura rubteroloni TaxID=1926885 RepID=A0A2P4URZ5_9ACTN|nr:protein-tyrosine phosphatase family protein [Actinomadura rubteroloni]POM27820.1 hypothetical protein BTM25_22420 [Actinomadura rubteroloni]